LSKPGLASIDALTALNAAIGGAVRIKSDGWPQIGPKAETAAANVLQRADPSREGAWVALVVSIETIRPPSVHGERRGAVVATVPTTLVCNCSAKTTSASSPYVEVGLAQKISLSCPIGHQVDI
jgi:hypothetical protein